MARKSLIVKLGAIGDAALVLPAAWRLHSSGFRIDWLCGKTIAPLLNCYSWIRTIALDESTLFAGNIAQAVWQVLRTWVRLGGESYDLCAILQYDRRYAALTLPVRSRRSIIFRKDSRRMSFVSERHQSAEYARILCGLADECRDDDMSPVAPDCLPPNPLPRNGRIRIAIAPGGARNLLHDDPLRRWPVESYVLLARLLLENRYEVILTGGPSDSWIVPYFRDLSVTNCVARWTLPQLLAFYESCNCVVTHDTGALHLAGLSSCGVVGLFGPTAASKALPRRRGVVGLWGGERLACRPCYDGRAFPACGRNECMRSIPPQRVLSAVESLIEHPQASWRVEHL